LLQWHIYCAKPCSQLTSVKFIAQLLENQIPCGFADHQCIEILPIVRFIGTKVADLFSSTVAHKGEMVQTQSAHFPDHFGLGTLGETGLA
jgi:hypothetical protein